MVGIPSAHRVDSAAINIEEIENNSPKNPSIQLLHMY